MEKAGWHGTGAAVVQGGEAMWTDPQYSLWSTAHLVRHGGGAHFPCNSPLLEVAQADVGPHIAVKVQQDGVEPAAGQRVLQHRLGSNAAVPVPAPRLLLYCTVQASKRCCPQRHTWGSVQCRQEVCSAGVRSMLHSAGQSPGLCSSAHRWQTCSASSKLCMGLSVIMPCTAGWRLELCTTQAAYS